MTRTGKNNRNFNPQLYLDNTRFTGVFFVHLIFLWYSYFAVFTVLEHLSNLNLSNTEIPPGDTDNILRMFKKTDITF